VDVSVDMIQGECCELQISSLQEDNRAGVFITLAMEKLGKHISMS
jgi:hypothetical protein